MATDLATIGFRAETGDLDRANKKLYGLAEQGGRTEKALGAVGVALSAIAVGANLQKAVDTFSKFETGLVGVAKTTGLAGAELDAFAKRIESISGEIPVTTDELLALAQAAGQMGVTGSDNLEKFSVTMAKLGRASDLAGEEAAKALARIINVTGESIDSIDTLASVMVGLGNSIAATESEIARMTTEVARATSVFGVSSAEAAALGGAMASIGIQAELGGSSVGRAMEAINNSIQAGGEEFDSFTKTLGISSEALQEAFANNKVEALKLFLSAVDNLGLKAGAALKEVGLGGQEIAKTIIPLANNMGILNDTLAIAGKEATNATALNKEYEATLSTLQSQFDLSKNSVNAYYKEIGERLSPAVSKSLKLFNEFTSEAGNVEATVTAITTAFGAAGAVMLASTVPSLAKYTASTVTAGLANITATKQVTGMSAALGVQSARLGATAIAANTAGAAFRFMLGPVGLAITALGAAVAAFDLTKDSMEEASKKAEEHANKMSRLHKIYEGMTKQQLAGAYLEAQQRAIELDSRRVEILDQLEKAQEQERESNRRNGDSRSKFTNQYTAQIESLEQQLVTINGQSEKTAETLDLINKVLQDGVTTGIEWESQTNKNTKALKDQGDAAGDSAKQSLKAAESYAQQVAELESQRLKLTMTSNEFEEYQAVQRAIATGATPAMIAQIRESVKALQEQREAVNRVNGELDTLFDDDSIFGETADEVKELAEETDEWGDLTVRQVDRIDNAFSDVWYNILDGGENVFDSLEDSFKRMLAEMAHQALTKPIMLNVQQALTGGGAGGLLGGIGGLLGAGGVGIGSSIAGIGGLLGGVGLGGLGSSLGLFGGAFGASSAMLGAGQFGAAAGFAGNLLGAGSLSGALGAALPIAGVAAVAGKVVSDVLGLNGDWELAEQKVTVEIIGDDFSGEVTTREKKKKFFKNRYRETSEDLADDAFDAMFGGLQDSIANWADYLDIDFVTTETTHVLGKLGDGFARGTQLGLETITTKSKKSIDDYLSSFSASLDFDTEGMSEEEIQTKINQWAQNVSQTMVDEVFGEFLSGMKREGESNVEALNRLVATFEQFSAVTETLRLNFDATGQEAVIAANNIVDMVGGLQNFNNLSGQLAGFAGFSEQWSMAYQPIFDTFTELEMTIPKSRDAFFNLMQGIDQSTESGQQLYATLLKLVPNLEQWYTLEEQNSQQRFDLQIRLLRAQGKEEEALAMIRERTLDQTRDGLKWLTEEVLKEEELARKREEAVRAAEEAARLEERRSNLQVRLLEAQGKSEQALALSRQLELEALDPSLRAIMEQIHAEQDLAKEREEAVKAAEEAERAAREAAAEAERIQKKRTSLEIQLLQAQGKEVEALARQRELELEALDPSLRALMQQIYAEQDLTKEREEAARAAEEAKQAEKERLDELYRQLQSNVDSARTEVEKARDAELDGINALEEAARDRFEAEVNAINGAAEMQQRIYENQRSALQDQLSLVSSIANQYGAASRGVSAQQALEAARRGDFSLAENINTGGGSFASATQQRVAQAREAFALAEIGKLADQEQSSLERQLSAVDRQIDAIEASAERQIAILQNQLDNEVDGYAEQREQLNQQINELLGIDNSVMSLEAATALFEREQKALLELDYENQIAALEQSTLQTEIQTQQVEMQSEQITLQAEQNEKAQQQIDELKLIGGGIVELINLPPKYEIPIIPPKETMGAEMDMLNEMKAMRAEMQNNLKQVAEATTSTAISTRRLEQFESGNAGAAV